MPTFLVTSPDGGTYQVNTPEGATENDAISYVQNNHSNRLTRKVSDSMSGYQTTMAGIGKGMTDLIRGSGQRLREGVEFMSPPSKGLGNNITGNNGISLSNSLGLPTQSDIDSARRIDQDLMSTTGGKVGNIIGQGALIAPTSLIPGANTYAGASAIGGLAGLLQPTSQDESRLDNVWHGVLGGLGGQLLGNTVASALGGMPYAQAKAAASSKGGNSASSADISGSVDANMSGGGASYGSVGDDLSAGLNQPTQDILKIGRGLGFKVTPGQASGSRALSQFEAKLESQPMTSGTFNSIKNNNETILNRIGAKSIGEISDTVDSGVLQKAQERIVNVYKIVADNNPRQINPDNFLSKLGGIESEFEGLVNITDNALVKKFINHASNGSATGKQLQDLASKMGKVAANEMTSANGDRQLGLAMFQVKDYADDLLQQGLSGETAKTFQNARGQYRNMMLLTSRNGVLNPSSGNLSGNALAGLFQQKDKSGFLFNKNNSDLYNAARFSQAFKPLFNDSGTSTRSMITSPTDFVLSLPFKVGTKAYASAPVVNASVGINNALRNGLIDPRIIKYLPKTSSIFGGLLGANSN